MSLVRDRLLSVMNEPAATSNVETYFAEPGLGQSAYTGRLFEQFAGGGDRDGSANVFTYDDLVAVESLSVQVPPEAAYTLMHGPLGGALEDLLRLVPTNVDLGTPEAHPHLGRESAADRAWALLKAQTGIGWVTAGKLLARKRPRLLPVYDDVVRCVLGAPKDVWLALDRALADANVQEQVTKLRPAAPIHVSALRVVDVAVWMRHHGPHARGECDDFGPV